MPGMMDYSLRIYDQLLQFTLFQGMSHADLMEVVTHTKLGFNKLGAGRLLMKEGDVCNHLVFLISGTLQCATESDDHSCRVVESMTAPHAVQPECLFGLSQRYTSTFHTLTDCSFIHIDKQEVMLLLETQLVFRLNLLNQLAAETHRMHHYAWRSAAKSLRERIIRFFFSRCMHPAGHKTFYILMQQIANELNDSRLDVSRALNEMQHDKLITLHRGRIEIPFIERLLM